MLWKLYSRKLLFRSILHGGLLKEDLLDYITIMVLRVRVAEHQHSTCQSLTE